jgi:peptide/nickel transport system substrate-binding protein
VRRIRWTLRAAALAVGAALLTAGCGGAAAPAAGGSPQAGGSPGTTATAAAGPVRGGSIAIDIISSVSTADPQNARTVTDLQLAAAIADPLIAYDPVNDKYVPMLAKSWEISQDGLTYTFHLQSGATFQDGTAIDAAAVKANLDRVMDPKNNLYAAGDLRGVTGVTTSGADTVVIKLGAPNADFLLSLSAVRMISPAAFQAPGANPGVNPTAGKPFGSGPFEITSYTPSQEIVVSAYKDYWGGAPYLDRITFRVTPEQATREVDLRSGNADLVDTLPEKDASSLQQAGFNILAYGRVNLARLAINVKTVPDPRVRQAICAAIDPAQILQHAYYGFGKVATTFIYPGSWADSSSLPQVTPDPARAKQLLQQAGYTPGNDGYVSRNGQELTLNFPSSPEEDWLTASQLIQQMLKAVGINAKITTSAQQVYYDQVRTGHYDISWWLTNYNPDPPVALTDLLSTNYWNVSQMSKADNAKIDTLLNQGTATLDQSQRAAVYRQLDTLVTQNAYECPGVWFQTVDGMSKSLHGVDVYPTGMTEMYQKWWKSK